MKIMFFLTCIHSHIFLFQLIYNDWVLTRSVKRTQSSVKMFNFAVRPSEKKIPLSKFVFRTDIRTNFFRLTPLILTEWGFTNEKKTQRIHISGNEQSIKQFENIDRKHTNINKTQLKYFEAVSLYHFNLNTFWMF